MKKPKLGSGGRFKAGVAKIMAQHNPKYSKHVAEAIMATAGRKKYGAKKMASMAAAGRKRKSGY